MFCSGSAHIVTVQYSMYAKLKLYRSSGGVYHVKRMVALEITYESWKSHMQGTMSRISDPGSSYI